MVSPSFKLRNKRESLANFTPRPISPRESAPVC